jgi:HsdM N-terminal domain
VTVITVRPLPALFLTISRCILQAILFTFPIEPMARPKKTNTTANLGFEAQLWAAADALRNNMDAAEYKHVVLGLIFLKYISDAFESKHADLEAAKAQGADPEDPDEYRAGIIRRGYEGL